ncbi:hypothetical protein ANCCEY_05276 [Ancylostoma ceylanicum]|uniref:Uncharacterized protein n=1 Tax=Ancylostoma ceylanicum TaxID=53326 RepID=A0A0D6LU96_9BILA|nr:hypothetical protein ANCCEY_05276 [Ancylostoma ceylanicum]
MRTHPLWVAWVMCRTTESCLTLPRTTARPPKVVKTVKPPKPAKIITRPTVKPKVVTKPPTKAKVITKPPVKPKVITKPTTEVITTTTAAPISLQPPNVTEVPTELVMTMSETTAVPTVETTPPAAANLTAISDEVDGNRFGLQPNSRLEYEIVPDSFDKRLGHLPLASSVAAIVVRSEGSLVVDDESADAIVSAGTDAIDTQPPLYLGGIPNELASYARTILPVNPRVP